MKNTQLVFLCLALIMLTINAGILTRKAICDKATDKNNCISNKIYTATADEELVMEFENTEEVSPLDAVVPPTEAPFGHSTTVIKSSQQGNIISDYCYTSCEWFSDRGKSICQECPFQFIQYVPPPGTNKCYNFPQDLSLFTAEEINEVKSICSSPVLGGCKKCEQTTIHNTANVNLMLNAFLVEAFKQFELSAEDDLRAKVQAFHALVVILTPVATRTVTAFGPELLLKNCATTFVTNRDKIVTDMTNAVQQVKNEYLIERFEKTTGIAASSANHFKLKLASKWKDILNGSANCLYKVSLSTDSQIQTAAKVLLGTGDYSLSL